MKKFFAILITGVIASLGGGALFGAAAAAPATGQIRVVQALPGQKVGVLIDDKSVNTDAAVGSVLGPFNLPTGKQKVTFNTGGNLIHTFIDVRSGSNSDIVLHLPAQVDAAPVVNTYQVPLSDIGTDKSRVLIAHAATVGAVDIAVNGKTTFRKVANGQYAQADMPAGTYDVSLTQISDKKKLGAFEVPLEASTLSMIFAYAEDGQMKTIVDSRKLADDGTIAPTVIHTGSAGLADSGVSSFGFGAAAGTSTAVGLGTLATVVMAGLVVLRARRRVTPAAAVSRRTR